MEAQVPSLEMCFFHFYLFNWSKVCPIQALISEMLAGLSAAAFAEEEVRSDESLKRG